MKWSSSRLYFAAAWRLNLAWRFNSALRQRHLIQSRPKLPEEIFLLPTR